MIPVLIGVAVVLYIIFLLAPGDPMSSMVDPRITLQAKAEMRHRLHLDQSPVVQFGYWAKDLLHGNLGMSTMYKQPVSSVLGTYIWNSFYLGLASFILSIILAIPIGVISATKQYSFFDYFFTIFALIGISMPSFFFGLLLMKWFAVDHMIFPVSGMVSAGVGYKGLKAFGDVMWHMGLPLIVLTLAEVAGIMRYVRSSMLEVIRQDYIKTARSKGLSEKIVIYRHALRNALIPVITIFGSSLAGLFSGAIITEQIFNWPGIGPISILATFNRDYPLLMGINLILAVLTLMGNLIADVSYALVDPRIRLK